MKKILSIALVFILIAMFGTTMVKATSNTELVDQLYSMGQKYGMTSSDKVRMERYLADNPVSSSDADAIIAKAKEAVNIMESAGTTNFNSLTADQKNQLKDLANQAASIAGVTLKFNTSSVEVYKDGKLIDTLTSNNGKLVYTGSDLNVILIVVSSVAIIALASATLIVSRKRKLVNA